MEYGLPPPRRIESSRDREMAKKLVYTMAEAEKAAPDRDWHIPVWATDDEV